MTLPAQRRALALLAIGVGGAIAAIVWWLPGPDGSASNSADTSLTYVGAESCVECHQAESELWSGSHHDLAMQAATESSVLGDFEDAEFTYAGVTSRFFRRDNGFFVTTDGPDGAVTDFAIDFVFGFTPLQQYLIALPGGRYQTLGIAWDSRPEEAGGQRWFHLYPNESVDHLDVLHWTKLSQSWDSQCAECHSTNLQKNYVWPDDRFDTTFSEINVACEACHGPASRHVTRARDAAEGGSDDLQGNSGLVVRFDERRNRPWEMDAERGIAVPPEPPPELRVEVETCARCHARRGVLTEDYLPGQLLGQTHHPALLDAGLYYPDGQKLDEVYTWASFLQSRMYAVGVTCSDCHDPHSARLRIPGNAVCSSCHDPEQFAAREHHFHEPEGEGGSCVACHMRAKTFMGVDARHDHSFRPPRPHLTVALGTPNPCNDCHQNRSAKWARSAALRWYPEGQWTKPHFGETLLAGRTLQAGAEEALAALASDDVQPGIVRGTAVSLLRGFMGPVSGRAIEAAVKDPDPLVRLAAASALDALEPRTRLRIGGALLVDPVRAVRVEAVVPLADVPSQSMTASQRVAFDAALDEFFQAQRANAERPEAHVNMGLMRVKQGDLEAGRRAYESALQVGPWFLPAYVNLADLFRQEGREAEAEAVLRKGLEGSPESPALHHALGLTLVRQERLDEALVSLARATELLPEDAQLAYVYAIGLHSVGRTGEALQVLRQAHGKSPASRPVIIALATLNRDRGAGDQALFWARKLALISPDDPGARQFVAELERQ